MSYTSEFTTAEPSRAEIDAMPGLVLLEFGAPWCGYCQAVQGSLEELLDEHSETTHIKVYDGPGKPLGRSFRVKLWPNLVFLRDGKVILQLARPRDKEITEGIAAIRSMQ